MTREELSNKLLQLGFELVKSTEKGDEFEGNGITVFVYEYSMTTNWYIGEEKQTRHSVWRSFTWKNKRFSSRAYDWSEFEETIAKQIKDGKFVYQPVNDQSVQQAGLLPNEA